jgi:hypothetical protein
MLPNGHASAQSKGNIHATYTVSSDTVQNNEEEFGALALTGLHIKQGPRLVQLACNA